MPVPAVPTDIFIEIGVAGMHCVFTAISHLLQAIPYFTDGAVQEPSAAVPDEDTQPRRSSRPNKGKKSSPVPSFRPDATLVNPPNTPKAKTRAKTKSADLYEAYLTRANVSTEGANEKSSFWEDFDPHERIRHIREWGKVARGGRVVTESTDGRYGYGPVRKTPERLAATGRIRDGLTRQRGTRTRPSTGPTGCIIWLIRCKKINDGPARGQSQVRLLKMDDPEWHTGDRTERFGIQELRSCDDRWSPERMRDPNCRDWIVPGCHLDSDGLPILPTSIEKPSTCIRSALRRIIAAEMKQRSLIFRDGSRNGRLDSGGLPVLVTSIERPTRVDGSPNGPRTGRLGSQPSEMPNKLEMLHDQSEKKDTFPAVVEKMKRQI
ncbi:hypothetical protein B0H11DRAFT_1923072 [Mycena galericulata]|nr:hypothetical protein B0H11DRAFT_1923072 [Mycena galericulata]